MVENIIEDPILLGYPGWGSGSISDRDWNKLKETIQEYSVKSMCEIGIGLSTLLMSQLISDYIGYDTNDKHLSWMKTKVLPHVELRKWDGKNYFNLEGSFDMGFIDGPNGAKNRFPSFQSIIGKVKILAMHDTGYIYNDVWRFELDPEEKYKVVLPGGRLSIWKLDE